MNKQKVLGQFFSGVRLAHLISTLVDKSHVKSIIDPMCGIGDMFSAYEDAEMTGVEIDALVQEYAQKRYPAATIFCGDAFAPTSIQQYSTEGYDLVVTNPPYVRRETLNNSGGIQMEMSTIRQSLLDFLAKVTTLTAIEKIKMRRAITDFSGLADLAVPSWLLCMMLVKDGGQMAIVVPNSWQTREYATTVQTLLKDLFEIKYVINDVSNTWFKDSAQVRTSVVVAKRSCHADRNTNVTYIDLYDKASNRQSLYGNIGETDRFQSVVRERISIPGMCEFSSIRQADLYSEQITGLCPLSKLRQIGEIPSEKLMSLSDYQVKVSQGLRTGANGFFYLKAKPGGYYSSIYPKLVTDSDEFFVSVLQGQEGLGDTFSVSPRQAYGLLYVQNAATSEDLAATPEPNKKGYTTLPEALSAYIRFSENCEIKGKTIPDLSSVKTNVSKHQDKPFRFWYMIPTLQPRHVAKLFMPRVNSKEAVTYINDSDETMVIDANFITFNILEGSRLTTRSLLALLNSTWSKIILEECGTVMGGGALKIDAVQFKKAYYPRLSDEEIVRLDAFGEALIATSKRAAETLIGEIDNVLLKALGFDDLVQEEKKSHLDTILKQYIEIRS